MRKSIKKIFKSRKRAAAFSEFFGGKTNETTLCRGRRMPNAFSRRLCGQHAAKLVCSLNKIPEFDRQSAGCCCNFLAIETGVRLLALFLPVLRHPHRRHFRYKPAYLQVCLKANLARIKRLLSLLDFVLLHSPPKTHCFGFVLLRQNKRGRLYCSVR